MKHLGNGIYQCRNYWIFKRERGWEIEDDLNIYATLIDVKRVIENKNKGKCANIQIKMIGKIIGYDDETGELIREFYN